MCSIDKPASFLSVASNIKKFGEAHNTDDPPPQPIKISQSPCHVLIVGCGLGGLASAIGIRKAGHEVTVLERAAELQEV